MGESVESVLVSVDGTGGACQHSWSSMGSSVRKLVSTHGVRVPWKAWCGNLPTLMECREKLGESGHTHGVP